MRAEALANQVPDVVTPTLPDVAAPIAIVETGTVVDATEPAPASAPKAPRPKPGVLRWIQPPK